jgi:thioredoxin 1
MKPNSTEPWKILAFLVLLGLVGAALGWLFVPAPSGGSRPRDKLGAEPWTYRGEQGGGRVEHATEATFGQQVLASPSPVLVEFYADWCAPCQALAPVLEELARETPGAKIVKVNVDHEPKLAARYGVGPIPRFLVLRGGEVAADHVGTASKDRLKAMLGL